MPVRYKDYYQILGVSRSATQEEIKRAYRQRAKQLHPDRANGIADSDERFMELVEAHEVLGDPGRRSSYDRLGSTWRQGEDFTPPRGWTRRPGGRVRVVGGTGRRERFSDFYDLFSDLNGPGRPAPAAAGAQAEAQPRPKSDLETELAITLEEAFQGTEKTVTLAIQRKSRFRGTRTEKKTFKVKIPAGVREGQLLRLRGEGGRTGGREDDILIRIAYAPHPRFDVDGEDLLTDLPVTPWEAALGASVRVQTLTGVARLKLPSPTSSGQRVRMRGQGLPRGKGERGDLICRILVELPEELSEEESKLFRQLSEVSSFNPRVED